MRILAVLPLVALLAACGTMSDPRVAGQQADFGDAVASPLYDFNVLKTKIPVVLLEARDRPYQLPTPVTCAEIVRLIEPLDEALGPDLDQPPGGAPGLLERGGELAVGAVGGATSGLLPMRSWVRTLSGAERHDRLVREAIIAGGVRRAFLKGLGQAGRCRPPATPSAPALRGDIVNPVEPEQRGPQYPIR